MMIRLSILAAAAMFLLPSPAHADFMSSDPLLGLFFLVAIFSPLIIPLLNLAISIVIKSGYNIALSLLNLGVVAFAVFSYLANQPQDWEKSAQAEFVRKLPGFLEFYSLIVVGHTIYLVYCAVKRRRQKRSRNASA